MTELTQQQDLLQPYRPRVDGPWTRREAAHLLRRAQFGVSAAEVETAVEVGLAATLDRLLQPQQETDEFLASEALLRQNALDTGNIDSLKAWWLYRMIGTANPLLEKMSLFWHGHFATAYAKVQSVTHMAVQNDLIREHALGSFRSLLHGLVRDVAMLLWLDGNANRRRHANENFARELLELFSLGIGNYSEMDVAEAARAFTGWHVRSGEFWFNQLQHDNGAKQVFGRNGALDGGDVVDLCLQQPACARFLANKLLRNFVMPTPPDGLVEQLAANIRANDLVLAPVLRELFGSKRFFSVEARAALIKSPLDLALGAQRVLDCRVHLQATATLLAGLGQDLFDPPTVKGWDGGRVWITSASLLRRDNFASELCLGDRYGRIAVLTDLLDGQGLIAPQAIVRRATELLLAVDLDVAATSSLEGYLHRARGSREQRLRGLVHLIMTLPEYQLM